MYFSNTYAQNSIPSKNIQITEALLAAPANKRAEATVLGYNKEGKIITLKKGSNELICLTDDPNDNSFSVACYHKDLDPFMARGRALRAEGKKQSEVFAIREKEAKSGKLKMPNHATTLTILYGKDENSKFNVKTGKVNNVNYRWVVYLPWATAKSTGLPTKPMVPGGPWLMLPGTHKAHIMITPPWPKN